MLWGPERDPTYEPNESEWKNMSRIDDLIRWEQFRAKKARKEAREAAETRAARDEKFLAAVQGLMPALMSLLGQYTGDTRPTAFPCGAPNPVDGAAPIADGVPFPFRPAPLEASTEAVDLGKMRIPACGFHQFEYNPTVVCRLTRLFVETAGKWNVLISNLKVGQTEFVNADASPADVPCILFAAEQPDPGLTFQAIVPGQSIKVRITNPQSVPVDVKVYGLARFLN